MIDDLRICGSDPFGQGGLLLALDLVVQRFDALAVVRDRVIVVQVEILEAGALRLGGLQLSPRAASVHPRVNRV